MPQATQSGSIVLVGDSDDLLIRYMADQLQSQGADHFRLTPSTLGDVSLLIQNNTFTINKIPIAAIFFRAYPTSLFSQGFQEDEAPFVDAELRAVWLAAFNLPQILSINRYDAIAWFESLAWPTWRLRLREAEIPISRFNFGGGHEPTSWVWYPYDATWSRPPMGSVAQRLMGTALTRFQSTTSVLIANGQVINGTLPDAAQSVLGFLTQHGISLAEIIMDTNGHVIILNPMPVVGDESTAQQTASVLVRQLNAHLHSWRS